MARSISIDSVVVLEESPQPSATVEDASYRSTTFNPKLVPSSPLILPHRCLWSWVWVLPEKILKIYIAVGEFWGNLYWYELYGIVDTRDTCALSRYFLLLRYTAVYRDLRDTGIVTYVSTISVNTTPNTIFITDHTTGYFVNVLPDWLIVILSLECYIVICIDWLYVHFTACLLYTSDAADE